MTAAAEPIGKLRFTPYAWAKLVYIRDIGHTEVSFLAITMPEDPSLVVDVRMVPQTCSSAYTEFKEEGLADFFEKMVYEEERHPENFGRIWCHTHPGASASPSGTDEETFKREFSAPDWAIMFILGKTGQVTCRFKARTKTKLMPFVKMELPVVVEVHSPWVTAHIPTENCEGDMECSEEEKTRWKAEYDLNVDKTYNYNGGSTLTSSHTYGNNWNSRNFHSPEWYRERVWVSHEGYVKKEELRKKGWIDRENPDKYFDKSMTAIMPASSNLKTPETSNVTGALPYFHPETPGYSIKDDIEVKNGKMNIHGEWFAMDKREWAYYEKHKSMKGYTFPANKGYKPPGVVQTEPKDEKSETPVNPSCGLVKLEHLDSRLSLPAPTEKPAIKIHEMSDNEWNQEQLNEIAKGDSEEIDLDEVLPPPAMPPADIRKPINRKPTIEEFDMMSEEEWQSFMQEFADEEAGMPAIEDETQLEDLKEMLEDLALYEDHFTDREICEFLGITSDDLRELRRILEEEKNRLVGDPTHLSTMADIDDNTIFNLT